MPDTTIPSHYRLHAFVCTTIHKNRPGPSCGDHGTEALRLHLKARARALGLADVQVSSASCLGRCDLGPLLVIYPEAVWYSFKTIADLDEILDIHLVKGGKVERLLVPPERSLPATA